MAIPRSKAIARLWDQACDRFNVEQIKSLGMQAVQAETGKDFQLVNAGEHGLTKLHRALTRGDFATAHVLMDIPGIDLNQLGFFRPSFRISGEELIWPPRTPLDVAIDFQERNGPQSTQIIGELREAGAQLFKELGALPVLRARWHFVLAERRATRYALAG